MYVLPASISHFRFTLIIIIAKITEKKSFISALSKNTIFSRVLNPPVQYSKPVKYFAVLKSMVEIQITKQGLLLPYLEVK